MANNVAASMTASIVIDKNDIVVQALKELSKAQKELNDNKLEIFFDVSDEDIRKKLKEIQKQLRSEDYVVKIQNQGVEEVCKNLDELIGKVKDIVSGKAFGSGSGKGIGNSIVDEKSLNNIIDLFTKMESHLGDMKKVFSDVGDGEEFSPLLKMINNVQSAISELSTNVKGIRLNMNIDVGSDEEIDRKLQSKVANALQAYQKLFNNIKMSSAGGSFINQAFFDFNLDDYDTAYQKLKAIVIFIKKQRAEAKKQFNGYDALYEDSDKSLWKSAQSYLAQVTKVENEIKKVNSDESNPLENLFGNTKDLSEVIEQLNKIVEKLNEISSSATEFKNVFKEGFNVTTSVEEIDKLTNRVKELEDELSKIKLNPVDVDKSNISSENNTSLATALSGIEKYKKETAYINDILSFNTDEELNNSIKQKYEELFDAVKNGSKSAQDAILDLSDHVNLCLGSTTELENILNRVGIKPDSMGRMSAGGISYETASFKIGENDYTLLQDYITGEFRLLDAQKQVINSYKDYETILHSFNNSVEELKQTQEQTAQSVQDISKTQIEDVFQGDKIDQTTTSAKELDKTLEQVNIPTDSFDEVLSKLDLTKSELKEIVKITKQSVSDSEGKFHDSYTLKDKLGSTEIYGLSSNTEKGQLLRSNIVQYDYKNAEQDAKALLEVERQLTKEAEQQTSAQQKKWKAFQQEQANYEKTVNEVNNAISKTDELLNKLQLHEKLDSQFLGLLDSVDELNSKLKAGEISVSDYNKSVKSLTSEYSKLVTVQQNRDMETYKQNAKATEQEAKAVKEVWDKNVKAIQDYMDAVTKLNNLKAQDKGTGTKSNQITLQEKNVEDLKEKALDARAAITSMVNPHDVPIDTWRDWLDVMKKFDQASLGSAESVAKLEDALRNASESNLKSMKTSLQNYEGKLSDLSVKPDDAHRFPEYQAQLDSLNNAIQEYKTFVESLQGKGIIDESDINESDRLKANIEKLLKETKSFSSGDKGYTELGADKVLEKINSILEQNSAMSKKAKVQIKAYYNEILSGNPSRPLNEILDSVYKIVQAEREAGRAGQSWLEIFNTKKLHSFLGQAASMFSFYDLIRYGREGIDTIREFDDGLTKISYTMDMTKSQLDGLGKSVLEMANDLDSSINNAMQVSQIYANMNTSAEEIKKLSEPTLILSNLTGFDASTVADDIQAVTQQFEIAAEESMHIADVYDQISRNISVDYSKGIESIAEAVQVAGSTANQAGLSFEQLAAIVGKTVEKTRLEGSQVGNGLKTIMTRLSKVGELSEEVDNETLSQASESLKKVGIEVYNLDGSYRQFDVIMGELAGKWDSLTDAEKSNISFNIAATRQTNLLSAVLSNFSDSMQLAEEATNANGNALENNQKWVDSFGGHLQSLENTAKSAWINILDSETIKGGVDVLNSLLKVVVGLIDKFGVLGTTAIIGGGILGGKNLGKTYKCTVFKFNCFEYALYA